MKRKPPVRARRNRHRQQTLFFAEETNATRCSYASQLESARFEIGSVADGFHEFGVEDGLFPGGHGSFLKGVVVVVSSIAPVVALEIVPQSFDGSVRWGASSGLYGGSCTRVMLAGTDNEWLR